MGIGPIGKTCFLADKLKLRIARTLYLIHFWGPGVFLKNAQSGSAETADSSSQSKFWLSISCVELFGSSHPGMIHADEHLLNVFITSILGSASQEDLGSFYPLKDSLKLASFVVEAAKNAKDDGGAEFTAKLANDQSRSLVQFVLRELEARYGSNLFDTFDAYRNINHKERRSQIISQFEVSPVRIHQFSNAQ